VTLLEFEGAIPEENQEQSGEPEEAATEGNAVDELPECPDHRPSSFLKGKPRCMLIYNFYLFTVLSYRSWVKTLVALYLSLSRYRT
jgi:hypothetical protein